MLYKFIDCNEIKVIGYSKKLKKSQTENYMIIRNIWKRFNKELRRIKKTENYIKSWVKYGITYKYDYENYYMAAIETSSVLNTIPDSVEMTIPRNKYVCFKHTGKLNEIKRTIYCIYKDILPKNDFNITAPEKIGLIHFEKYDKRFYWNSPGSKLEICLPLDNESKY